MKKVIVMLGIMLVLPVGVVLAHGESEAANQNNSGTGMMMESKLDHEEMETLMKNFMVNRSLSETEADKMITHVNELLDMKMAGGMMEEDGKLSHEEMEGLMKTFLTKGSLSETEADKMVGHINELLNMGMAGGMMDGNEMGGGMMGGEMGHGDGDMMGGMMMKMGWMHGLVAVTSLVWLVAGILYLRGRSWKVENKQ